MQSFFFIETVGELRERTKKRKPYNLRESSPETRALIKLKRLYPNFISEHYYSEIIELVAAELRDTHDR